MQADFTGYAESMGESLNNDDYTLNNSYPVNYQIAASNLLTKTYYDNYAYINALSFDSGSSISTYANTGGITAGYFDKVPYCQITGTGARFHDNIGGFDVGHPIRHER